MAAFRNLSWLRHLAVFGAFSLLGAMLVWPIFGSGYPPGVDTATFLHLSWVTKLAVSGQLANPFEDPYWYGGFPYLVSYPPLGYGLVGVISFVTRLGLLDVYNVAVVMAYGGLATATYYLARELGLRQWSAALAGILTAVAYPVLSAIFLWGWFTSVLALPFGLVAFMLLERSLRTGNWRAALWGGLCMALSILTHHMTGLSLGLGLVGWFAFHAISGTYARRQVIVFSGLFTIATALLAAPWGIPAIMHILDVGFRREVPGLWLPSLTIYRAHIIDTSRIGDHVYPSYLGITLMVLALGGTVYALLERRRLAGVAVLLLVLVWFSMGANVNPLIRTYPFSGLDTARFHLYMAPFMALMGSALVERGLDVLRGVWPTLAPRIPSGRVQRILQRYLGQVWYALAVAALALILVFPFMDAWKARQFMGPYQVKESVGEAISWLADLSPGASPVGSAQGVDMNKGRVYSVGLWTWHSFLIPYLADQPLADGWHDEGAPNVHQIRQLRLMGWTRNVDIQKAHQLLSELGVSYVLVNRVSDFPGDAANLFWEGFEAHPGWFAKQQQWGDVAVFRVIP